MKSKKVHSEMDTEGLPPHKRLKSYFDDQVESPFYSKFPSSIRERSLDEYQLWKTSLLRELDDLIATFNRDPNAITNEVENFSIKLEHFLCLRFPFSLEEKATIIKKLMVFIDRANDVDYKDQCSIFNSIISLLKKKENLDLIVDWRPFAKILENTYFSKYRRVVYTPKSHSRVLTELIKKIKRYFPEGAVNQIINEYRPLLCLHDHLLFKAQGFICLLLPTNHRETHWLPEIINIWKWIGLYPTWDSQFFLLISSTAEMCIGKIDWNPYLDFFFQKVIVAFELPIGNSSQLYDEYPMEECSIFTSFDFAKNLVSQHAATFLIWTFNSTRDFQSFNYLKRLIKSIESFCHPSNEGEWSEQLAGFLLELTTQFAKRYQVEYELRENPVSDIPLGSIQKVVPEECLLTDDFKKEFVELLYPLALKAMYSKSPHMQACANHSLKQLCYVMPEVVFPPLLNQCSHALQTLTEIHQTVAALDVLSLVAFPLVRYNFFPGGEDYLLDLLSMTLPGIDNNDYKKTWSTFKFITAVLVSVPVFSENNGQAPHVVSFFEEWCFKLLDRIFSLLQNEGSPIFSNNTSDDYSSSIFRGFCNLFFEQLSPSLYEKCLKKVYQFVSTEFLVSAKENIGNLCEAVAFANQHVALQYFVPLCHDRLVDKKTGQLQQVTDNEKMWYVYILSRVIKRGGAELIPYQKQIWKVIELLIDSEEKKITGSLSELIQNYLHSLTTYYSKEIRSQNPTVWGKLANEEHWKYWGRFPKLKDLEVSWHEPSRQEILHAVTFVNEYLLYIYKKLQEFITMVKNDSPTTLPRNTIWSYFCLLESFVKCIPNFMPEMKGGEVPGASLFPNLQIFSGKVEYVPETNEPELKITLEMITELCCEASMVLFSKQRDVTLLIPVIVKCFPPLTCIRFGELRNEYKTKKSTHNMVKIQNFMVYHRDEAKYPRYLSLARINLELGFRNISCTRTIPFTKYHERIIDTLLTLSLSSYQKLRKKVHPYLLGIFHRYSNVVIKKYLPNVINILTSTDTTDDAVTGALSVLTKSQSVSTVTRDWKLLHHLIISLSRTKHIEKETTQAKLGEVFDLYFNSLYQIRIKNEEDSHYYKQLICELVQVSRERVLHWKFQTMIASFLLLLIRGDGVRFPLQGVCWLFSQLASDIPRVRLISSEAINLILAQYRPVQPRKEVTLSEKNLVGVWNSFPIPTNEKEFKQTNFFDKNCFGWYEVPKTTWVYDYSKSYDGPTIEIAQERESLKESLRKVMTPDWLERFFRYNSNRGGDPFSETMTQLYKGLFQIFGMEFYDIATPHIVNISKTAGSGKADESGHMAAISEFVSGFIRGMKNWNFNLQQNCQKKLIEFWDEVLDKCSQGTITEWTDGLEFAFSDKDPRRSRIIIEYFFKKFEDALGSSSSNLQARYAQLLYSIVGEISWRDTDLMIRVLRILSKYHNHPYQQVRETISMLMALIMKTIWVPKRDGNGRISIKLPTMYLENHLRDNRTNPQGDDTESHFPYIKEFMKNYLSLMEIDENTGKLRLFSSLNSGTDILAQKEEERRCLKSYADTMLGFISSLYATCAPHAMEKYTIGFIRVCAILQDQNDENMHSEANESLLTIADYPFSPLDAKEILLFIINQFNTFTNWRVRRSFLSFLSIFVFKHQFSLEQDRDALFSLLLQGLKDQQVEVRQAASTTLAGFLRISDENVVKRLAEECINLASDPLENRQKRRKRRGSLSAVTPQSKRQEDVISRHAGVLGLRAVITAYPHEIPEFLPPILVLLARYNHDRVQQIRESVRLTFSDFWKCHRDSWRVEKKHFDDDQLVVLTDLLVSPSYYA